MTNHPEPACVFLRASPDKKRERGIPVFSKNKAEERRAFVKGKGLMLFPTVAAVMLAVGPLAAAGPARRGLAIEPTEAPRTE